MDKSRINDMVDRKIIQSFQEGFSIGSIQSDLKVRIRNFTNTIGKDSSVNYMQLYDTKFEDIPNIRHRYGITYIKQCQKRLQDLDWIIEKKSKFSNMTYSKVFKLIQFREKLESTAKIYPFK
jgi:hypothetical protein